jgi:hypothetical protein
MERYRLPAVGRGSGGAAACNHTKVGVPPRAAPRTEPRLTSAGGSAFL